MRNESADQADYPAATDKDLSDIKKNYTAKGGCFKVIEDGSGIVGSYGLFPLSRTRCKLRKMYLLPEYQGKGIGRLIMDDAIAEARKRRFRDVVLETNSVLDKACRPYRRYGFEEYKPDHLSDRCDCAMKLRL